MAEHSQSQMRFCGIIYFPEVVLEGIARKACGMKVPWLSARAKAVIWHSIPSAVGPRLWSPASSLGWSATQNAKVKGARVATFKGAHRHRLRCDPSINRRLALLIPPIHQSPAQPFDRNAHPKRVEARARRYGPPSCPSHDRNSTTIRLILT